MFHLDAPGVKSELMTERSYCASISFPPPKRRDVKEEVSHHSSPLRHIVPFGCPPVVDKPHQKRTRSCVQILMMPQYGNTSREAFPLSVNLSERTRRGMWAVFDRCAYGIRTVDKGGNRDCFFTCALSYMQELAGGGWPATVPELRALITAELEASYPSGPANVTHLLRAALEAHPTSAIASWNDYLHALRRDLSGGDLEIGALTSWLVKRGVRVQIRLYTHRQSDGAVVLHTHGVEADPALVWRFAHVGAHYRVVVQCAAQEGPREDMYEDIADGVRHDDVRMRWLPNRSPSRNWAIRFEQHLAARGYEVSSWGTPIARCDRWFDIAHREARPHLVRRQYPLSTPRRCTSATVHFCRGVAPRATQRVCTPYWGG